MTNFEAPRYHHPFHQEVYDTEGVKETGAELEIVTSMIDDVLYSGGNTSVRPSRAVSGDGYFESYFRHSHLRSDIYSPSGGWVWPIQSVNVAIEHYRKLNTPCLRENYKISIENTVHQTNFGMNIVRTLYYIERFGDHEYPTTHGLILRPNIIGEEEITDEPMTPYDCEKLAEALDEVTRIINHEDKVNSGINRSK